MKKYKNCIIFLADGARADVFESLLDQGRLPNLKTYFLREGAYRRAVTSFPSTTGPAHMALLTGCYPGTCNVPGIRWFDRRAWANGHARTAGIRSYVGLESYLMNRDTDPAIGTLFERFERPVSIFSPFSKGVGFMGNRTILARVFYWSIAHTMRYWRWVDRNSYKYLVDSLHLSPDFIFAVFPAIDTLSHRTHPFSGQVLTAYEKLDEMAGRVVGRLQSAGLLEDTLLIYVSDHGLTETHGHFDVATFLEDQQIPTFRHPLVFKRNFSAAVMVSGNGMAHIYLKNAHGWRERTPYEEIAKEKRSLFDLLAARQEVAWVASRDRAGGIVVLSKRGRVRVSRDNGLIRYASEGDDPFHYGKLPHVFSEREALELTAESDYPDAPVQLLQIFDSPRTGDLVITARKGFDLRLRWEVPEHLASHGSLIKEHMVVPFLMNHPIDHERPIRTVDIFPTILKLMGKEYRGKIDGQSFL
jgi:predicted AlkP superfamily phosphohydrolase/phosphomutase